MEGLRGGESLDVRTYTPTLTPSSLKFSNSLLGGLFLGTLSEGVYTDEGDTVRLD